MFCKTCGEQIEDGVLVCPICATAVEVQAVPQPPEQRTQPQPQTPQYQQQPSYQQAPPLQYQQPTYQQTPPPPPQYQQPMYQQPVTQQNNAGIEHVSVGGWIGIFCINLIPLVGWLIYIIMLFVWAFGDTKKKTLKNFARATLLISAILIVLAILAFTAAAIAGVSLSEYFEGMENFQFDDFSSQMFIR